MHRARHGRHLRSQQTEEQQRLARLYVLSRQARQRARRIVGKRAAVRARAPAPGRCGLLTQLQGVGWLRGSTRSSWRARQRAQAAAASLKSRPATMSWIETMRRVLPAIDEISSMRPRRSASTCCAVVGDTCPDRYADGGRGRPTAARMARAIGWLGTRTAMVSGRAVASSPPGRWVRLAAQSEGPGQNASASRSAAWWICARARAGARR